MGIHEGEGPPLEPKWFRVPFTLHVKTFHGLRRVGSLRCTGASKSAPNKPGGAPRGFQEPGLGAPSQKENHQDRTQKLRRLRPKELPSDFIEGVPTPDLPDSKPIKVPRAPLGPKGNKGGQTPLVWHLLGIRGCGVCHRGQPRVALKTPLPKKTGLHCQNQLNQKRGQA